MKQKKQNIEKQYKIACEQYYKTLAETKQLKNKLKQETNPTEFEKLQHVLLTTQQILYKQKKRKENIYYKQNKSYQMQQEKLKFKNMLHYRLKRMFEDDKKIYSKNHIHSVNKIINDICKNNNEQEIYAKHMKEKKKPVLLSEIYSKLNV